MYNLSFIHILGELTQQNIILTRYKFKIHITPYMGRTGLLNTFIIFSH